MLDRLAALVDPDMEAWWLREWGAENWVKKREFFESCLTERQLEKTPRWAALALVRGMSASAERILDLGCGSWDFASSVPPTAHYIWIDFSSLVDARLSWSQNPSRQFIKHNLAQGIPSEAGWNFDVILAIFVLHFFTPRWIERLLEDAYGALGKKWQFVYIGNRYGKAESNVPWVMKSLWLNIQETPNLYHRNSIGYIWVRQD